ncbi:MAG: PQQ-dependent sugar dehydrogenase [Nitrosopumilus sp.]|nr:PQQ-dependent sugar dehydrogenase [Nitrosopumilus sp.]
MRDSNANPLIINQDNDNLIIHPYAEGLSFPTSMVFVDNNTIMVLEKDKGTVRLISNGILQKEPILRVDIDNKAERGLLGIAISKKETNTNNITLNEIHKHNSALIDFESSPINSEHFIYLYFTEKIKNVPDNNNYTIRNRIYEYSWNGQSLSNSKLIMDLPAELGPYHNGGKLKIGPDNLLYAVIGDLVTINNTLQNHLDENNRITIPNNSSVIIRINPSNGSFPIDNPFYKYYYTDNNLKALSYYYAYGIRNSFGFDFDPITTKLWDTENGEKHYDEINLVEPGFNSGWYKIMGPIARNNDSTISDLVMINGSYYSDPIFSWFSPIGITDLEFLESPKLGKKYENNIFVGDINNGNLYFFEVNATRSGIDINNFSYNENKLIFDQIADTMTESDGFIFAKGFKGRITDIETGPDGYLYILTYFDGRIFRIS